MGNNPMSALSSPSRAWWPRAGSMPAPARGVAPVMPGSGLGFLVFLIVNATLFVRPAEIIPELLGLPIYQVLILTCLVFSLPAVVQQLSLNSLYSRPITACVLALLAAIAMSQLA